VLITSIVNEIRGYLAIDLEPTPTLERGVDRVGAREEGSSYLVVGSSNAAR
jgi:hypothetical protein